MICHTLNFVCDRKQKQNSDSRMKAREKSTQSSVANGIRTANRAFICMALFCFVAKMMWQNGKCKSKRTPEEQRDLTQKVLASERTNELTSNKYLQLICECSNWMYEKEKLSRFLPLSLAAFSCCFCLFFFWISNWKKIHTKTVGYGSRYSSFHFVQYVDKLFVWLYIHVYFYIAALSWWQNTKRM